MALSEYSLYSGFQICDALKLKQKCFRLRIYKEGEYHDLYHEHIPKHRISEDNAINFMKTLVAKYSGWDDSFILSTYLNNRGQKPHAEHRIQISIEYPEPGVMRRYCSSGNVSVWMDEK